MLWSIFFVNLGSNSLSTYIRRYSSSPWWWNFYLSFMLKYPMPFKKLCWDEAKKSPYFYSATYFHMSLDFFISFRAFKGIPLFLMWSAQWVQEICLSSGLWWSISCDSLPLPISFLVPAKIVNSSFSVYKNIKCVPNHKLKMQCTIHMLKTVQKLSVDQ